ncbi:MAG: sigma-70 family RNA polymerase sigma factor [Ruminococcus sp.]|nr:sigma-70 family RNA polymerase sigma factor [Ruminococcus sp.]
MQHNLAHITEENNHLISYSMYDNNSTNKKAIENMKKLLSMAMVSELTQRQRECLVMYYYENKRMNEIASILSLSPSTVTRHIKAAQKKLKSIAKYC